MKDVVVVKKTLLTLCISAFVPLPSYVWLCVIEP